MSGDPPDTTVQSAAPKVLFFDVHTLMTSDERRADDRPSRRVITTVSEQVSDVRKNVQDTARAVVTWVAAVCDHDSPDTLEDVLDRCLRPGPDVERVNYAAIADEVNRCVGASVSAKQVKTAIEHLRRGQQAKVDAMSETDLRHQLDALLERLRDNHAALMNTDRTAHVELDRAVAVQVLGAVRAAAGQVIDSAYGEGIPLTVDVDELESRFLDFVRDMVRETGAGNASDGLSGDLKNLLLVLSQYDGSAESNMRVVVVGSRVVADLQGPDSLPGLIGQLNVLVAGRYLLDSELYCAELARLAEAAGGLHDDTATGSLMNWVRRLPEDQRLPSPLRARSYCLNNAATHLLERVYRGEYAEPKREMERARACLEQMRERDSGFRLIATTTVIEHVVEAHRSEDGSGIEAHFRKLGEAESLKVLKDLAQFENATDIVADAQRHAAGVWPGLKHQLLRV